jgi:Arc-like DNA binding domain
VARKPTAIVKLQLRLPERLRRLLKEAAKGHSMNAEIVKRLEESLLRTNLAALMREHIDIAAKQAAKQAVEQAIQQLGGKL